MHTPSQICSASFIAKVLYGPLEMLREKFRVISCGDGLSSQLVSAHVELHIFLSCQIVGCDHQLGSAVKEDNCGVCNGDGSTCRLVRGQYKSQLSASKCKLFLLVKCYLPLLSEVLISCKIDLTPLFLRYLNYHGQSSCPHRCLPLGLKQPCSDRWSGCGGGQRLVERCHQHMPHLS